MWLPTKDALRAAGRSGAVLSVSVLACLALATMAGTAGSGADGQGGKATAAGSVAGALGIFGPGAFGARIADEQSAAALAIPVEGSDAAAPEAQAEPAAPAGPPAPVAGLNETQMANAWKIVQAGQAMGLPARAFGRAVAPSLQESNLYNLASTRIPESYQYNAEGEGSDHDSVGLFQQRASAGWGAVANLMDPHYSATAFYKVLVTVPGWDSMELTWAAQRVQVSAYPYHYAKHETRAQAIVDAILS